MNPQPQQGNNSAYSERLSQAWLSDEDIEAFNLSVPDDKLRQMLIRSLEDNRSFWNQAPWNLQETDLNNIAFLLGDQLNDNEYTAYDIKYKDNRLFTSIRAILSYVTGQLAKPELTPSKGDNIYLKAARDLEMVLYQHSLDEKVDRKVRAAVMNLIVRKRAFLKVRFDPNAGLNGDVVTELCNPEDVIVDRFAKYLDNPNIIYHRLRCTVDELIARFPKKKAEILNAYDIKQGRFTQLSKFTTYYEAWFTYIENGKPKEGVCWFLHDKELILDKMPNPNWLYTGSEKKDKEKNLLSFPPKPFVPFNYMNTGESFIDETSLFEQAKPQQNMLNRRGRQIMENADYVNGRWVASKDSFNEEDAQKLVNKGPKTIALAKGEDISKSLINVSSPELPSYVVNTLYDARSEIDNIMGTPAQFRGAQPQSQDTATRDLLVKQQAGALQDDLVIAVSDAMENYYKLKLQLMVVNYDEDHWFTCKGADGKYVFIMLNGNSIDPNVKIGVQTDSTLPLDKASIRSTSLELWKNGNAIDYLTLMRDLGLPDPEIRAERYYRSQLDPAAYLKSIEITQVNTDAESDIQLILANKEPDERDEYSTEYINYFNRFMASNRFDKLKDKDPEAADRVTAWLMAVQHVATNVANLQALLLNEAEMLMPPAAPPTPPQPQAPGLEGALQGALASRPSPQPAPAIPAETTTAAQAPVPTQ